MHQWESMQAEAIGTRTEVTAALAAILQDLVWLSDDGGHPFGEAVDPIYGSRFFVHAHEDENGQVAWLSTSNHASPSTLARIMDRFALNYCCTEFGDFRHPHHVDDDWKPTTK